MIQNFLGFEIFRRLAKTGCAFVDAAKGVLFAVNDRGKMVLGLAKSRGLFPRNSEKYLGQTDHLFILPEASARGKCHLHPFADHKIGSKLGVLWFHLPVG